MRLFKRIIGFLLIYLVVCFSISFLGWVVSPHLSFFTFFGVTCVAILILAALGALFHLGIYLLDN
jgi:hypothetical protein